MNLWLVTFDLDYSQFLVDAKNIEEAIGKAIEVNKGNLLGKCDPEEISEEEMNDRANYETYHVDDTNMLYNIIRRDDWVGIENGTIVFNG